MRRRTKRRLRRWLRRGLLLAGAAFVAALLFTVWQALQVRQDLVAGRADLSALREAVSRGNVTAAQNSLARAARHLESARGSSRGPMWWGASHLPAVGDDVTAVRTIADVGAELTAGTLPELVATGVELTSPRMLSRGGRIDVEAIERASPALKRGSASLNEAASRVQELETDGLVGVLKPEVLEVTDELSKARSTFESAATASGILPEMLGSAGPRVYLLEFQNNAEVRATGGLPGSFAVVKVDDGRLTLTRTSAPADIGRFDEPFKTIPDNERALFSNRVVESPQDVGINPDFPWGAETLAQMWNETQGGLDVDSVFAVDPIAFSYVLNSTGPVDVEGRRLTPANAVQVLLNELYLTEPDADAQNRFYADVVEAVFDRISAGDLDPAALVVALSDSIDERRAFLWSSRGEEQQVLDDLVLGGRVLDSPSARPDVGVFLNDSGSDKLTYYLDHRVDVLSSACGTEGDQVLDVKVALSSDVPQGVALPLSVRGPRSNGVRPGDMLLTTYLYAPPGGRVEDLRVDGQEVQFTAGSHRNREVASYSVLLPRQARRVLTYTVVSGDDQQGKPTVTTTTGVRSDGVGKVGPSSCE